MRRTKLVLAVAAAMVMMLALAAGPALADDNHDFFHSNDFFFPFNNFFNDGFASGDFQQRADSGDVNQSFDVSQTGDNSNQCAGIQGVGNTGNAQNAIGVTPFDNGFDNFHSGDRFFDEDFGHHGLRDFLNRFGSNDSQIEDSGASIEVSPTNTTTCDQQVTQAATASG